jgi:hypothetical protein
MHQSHAEGGEVVERGLELRAVGAGSGDNQSCDLPTSANSPRPTPGGDSII